MCDESRPRKEDEEGGSFSSSLFPLLLEQPRPEEEEETFAKHAPQFSLKKTHYRKTQVTRN